MSEGSDCQTTNVVSEADLFRLAYEQYRDELREADTYLTRASLLVPAYAGFAAVQSLIIDVDLLPKAFARPDIAIFIIASIVIVGLLFLGVICALLAATPKDYEALACMVDWFDWSEEKKQSLDTLGLKIRKKITNAQRLARKQNKGRQQRLKNAITMLSGAVIITAIQATFALVVHLRGMP